MKTGNARPLHQANVPSMKIQPRQILTIGLALLGACTAQDAPPEESASPPLPSVLQRLETPASRVQGVPKWVGVLKARSKSSGVWTGPYNTHDWKADLTYFAPIEVTMFPPSNLAFVDIKQGFYNISHTEEVTFMGMTTMTMEGRCAESLAAQTTMMELLSDSTYQMQLTPFSGAPCTGTVKHLDGFTGDVSLAWYHLSSFVFGSHFVFDLPAVDAPLRIHGTKHLLTTENAVLESIPNPLPYGVLPVEWDIEWDLRPKSDELDLVLSAENHDDWLPRAHIEPVVGTSLTSSETPPQAGSFLKVKARAVPKEGSTATSFKQITFHVISSEVEGIASNSRRSALPFPVPLPGVSYKDLQFEQPRNAALGLEFVSAATVQTPLGTYTEAQAEVSSFDFGSYGEVVAEGLTEDGKVVLAVLDDPASTPGTPLPFVPGPLLIPKRTPTSKIADKWKSDNQSTSLADNDDSDTLGAGFGDGHAGDGLTLYEEYRGFVLKGTHVRTRNQDVDYFLNNKMGNAVGGAEKAGITLFQSLTGLKVHEVGNEDFELTTRIINSARGAPHNNDQHLVIMADRGPKHGVSQTSGGPGTPKDILLVAIASDTPAPALSFAVAHELAHTVNVPHHGEGGYFTALWTAAANGVVEAQYDPPGSTVAGRVEIITSAPLLPTDEPPLVGVPMVATRCEEDGTESVFGGAHDCIMRYRADYMIKLTPVNERHYRHSLDGNKKEDYGTSLCSVTHGTGFNAQLGENRHGGAASGRGECKKKICVNDKHTHTPWAQRTCTPIRTVTSSFR
ncbi:hypothetical protein [Corallococcus exercitus]|uniref:hypothetical protein n=1 Tax=Corallococcus exercitus TaxID=2316736 RepID=UPI0035D4E74C